MNVTRWDGKLLSGYPSMFGEFCRAAHFQLDLSLSTI